MRIIPRMFFTGVLMATTASATVTTFFNPSQVAVPAGSGATSETINSLGYQFTYSADKYWSASPGGDPTGRFFSVSWPDGVQAQAVTAGPQPGPAAITLKRVDGNVFDLNSMSVKLLANTGGAGGAIEIMPLLNGIDGFADPLALDVSGYGGQTFNFTTPTLHGFDTYQMSLYVDFALTRLVLTDASVPEPATAIGMVLAGSLVRRRPRSCVAASI